nr:PAS domain S-box protein [uncultured Tolumonas sp.]
MVSTTNANIAAVGTITIDEMGCITAFDDVAVRLFGYESVEVVGQNVSMLMPEPYHSQHDGYLARYHQTSTPHVIGRGREVTGRRKDSSLFPVWLAVNEVTFGANRLFVGCIVDLSDLKATKADLLSSTEVTRAILETAVNPIITIDAKGHICSFNPAAERMFQYTASEAIGRNVNMLMPSPYREEHDGYLSRYLHEGNPRIIGVGREVTAQRKDGSIVPIHLSVGAMEITGEPMFVGIISDISEQKRHEAELQAKKAAEAGSRAKSAFLAHMSHEIRTPMNAILGFTELALQDHTLSPETAKHLDTIYGSARALLTIINDILDVSRLEAGKYKLEIIGFHLPNMIAETVELMHQRAAEKDLIISIEYDRHLPQRVMGDPTRLRQVILNLLSNAVKFTNKGSIKVVVSATSRPNHIQFDVVDTGIGMSEVEMAKVFEPFMQADSSISRRFGGTGLGTTICKQIIELMSGDIWLESQLGVGTTVHFVVPLPETEPDQICLYEEIQNKNEDFIPPRLFNVLLVEDLENNAYLATIRLKQIGHEVEWAKNGLEAIAAYQKGGHDLILMDVMMPVMDGLQATREIRQLEVLQEKHIPIIALTASVMKEDEMKYLEAGMDAIAGKPIDFDQLFSLMEAMVPQGTGRINHAIMIEMPVNKNIDLTPLHPAADYQKAMKNWVDVYAYIKALTQFSQQQIDDADVILHLLEQHPDDVEPARSAAHALKGLAGNLALSKVADLAVHIDGHLKSGRRDEASRLLEPLRQALIEADNCIQALSLPNDAIVLLKDFDLVAVQQLFQQLSLALDELNPDSTEPIMKQISEYVRRSDLAEIYHHIERFDFHSAKKELRKLAQNLFANRRSE